jgi:predicted ATP-dependent serine protease
MGLYIDSILNKKTYGLIISGSPGVGKSDMLEKKIKAKGLKPLEARKVPEKKVITDPKTKEKTEIDVARTEYVGDYTLIKGKITTSSFYEEICRNRHGLIVFDDCDSMFESSDGENLMKALLDSKKIREVSYYSKSAVMSSGDNDEEIMKILEDGKVPKKVVFDGQFVAITNLPLAKLDSAILSRVDKVSLNFNGPEIFKKIKITV